MRTVVAALLALSVLAPGARADYDVPHLPWGNHFDCRSAHRPVVLVHGAGSTAAENWSFIGPRLSAAGFCVFALTYGIDPRLPGRGGALPMEQSAHELATFIQRVGGQVDLVGHSEGTVMPRYYLERLDGARHVQNFVALAPLWRGSTFGYLEILRDRTGPIGWLAFGVLNAVCGACPELVTGSDFLNELNDDGEAIPGVRHTNIVTKLDGVVVPWESGLMRGGGTNIVLQDRCPADTADHVALAFDPAVFNLVLGALDPARLTQSCA